MLKDEYAQRACAFNLGATYIALCKFNDGVTVLLNAFPPISESDKNSNGDLYYNLGRGYEGIGDKERALAYYKKAAKDYEKEDDNFEMLRETQQRIKFFTSVKGSSIRSQKSNTYSDGSEAKDAVTMKTESMIKKAKELVREGEHKEAKSLADETSVYLCQSEVVENKGSLFNDLGLLYTELMDFEEAEVSFHAALTLINTEAANHYAEISNKSKECHCYANLAYAYSQLGELQNANKAFQTALKKSSETEDKHTEWQVLEGLGAVCYAQGDFENAVTHFRDALEIVGETESNLQYRNRINEKLKHAEKGCHKQKQRPVSESSKKNGENSLPDQMQVTPEIIHGRKTQTTISRESTIKPRRARYARVAREGSLRKFDKVAKGLAMETSLQSNRYPLQYSGSSTETGSSSHTESSSSESESESESDHSSQLDSNGENGKKLNENQTQSAQKKSVSRVLGETLASTVIPALSSKGINLKRPDDKIVRTRKMQNPTLQNGIAEEEEDSDLEAMQYQMRQIMASEGSSLRENPQFSQHKQPVVTEERPAISSDESTGTPKRDHDGPPPVPEMPPPATGEGLQIASYISPDRPLNLSPAKKGQHDETEVKTPYAEISWDNSHVKKPKPSGGNFFQTSTSDNSESSTSMEDEDQGPQPDDEDDEDDPVYQTIGTVNTDPVGGVYRDVGTSGLSRAQQDRLLSKEHQRRQKTDVPPPLPTKMKKDNSSKMCSLM
ncbi:hypothetical protein ScPMuIL_018500 [Solemya velum]